MRKKIIIRADEAQQSNSRSQEVVTNMTEVVEYINELDKKNRLIKQLRKEVSELRERVRRVQFDSKCPEARSLDALQLWHQRIISQLQPKPKSKRIPVTRQVAILLVDGDNFGSVNKEFDHTVGDQLIRQTAITLRNHIKSSDLLFRWGGDEFIVILSGKQSTKSLGKTVARLNQLVIEVHVKGYIISRAVSVSGKIFAITSKSKANHLSRIERELSIANNVVKADKYSLSQNSTPNS